MRCERSARAHPRPHLHKRRINNPLHLSQHLRRDRRSNRHTLGHDIDRHVQHTMRMGRKDTVDGRTYQQLDLLQRVGSIGRGRLRRVGGLPLPSGFHVHRQSRVRHSRYWTATTSSTIMSLCDKSKEKMCAYTVCPMPTTRLARQLDPGSPGAKTWSRDESKPKSTRFLCHTVHTTQAVIADMTGARRRSRPRLCTSVDPVAQRQRSVR